MAAKKRAGTKGFRAMVAIRVEQADADRLDALVERLPIATRHAIAREALRIGLSVLEEDPTQLVKSADSAPRTRSARAPARR